MYYNGHQYYKGYPRMNVFAVHPIVMERPAGRKEVYVSATKDKIIAVLKVAGYVITAALGFISGLNF